MAKKKISKKVLAAIQDKLTLVSLASPREPDQFKDLVNVKPEYYQRIDQPYLKESRNSTAVISFGRMNPPTIGHQKLVDKVKEVARSKGGRPMIFLSHTQDSKKNPLGYSDKIKFARAAFGRDVVKPSSAKTIIDIANKLSREYDNLVMVVGDDRVREFDSLLNKYNGQDYSFETIEIVSAGTRDPDSSDVAGMSASKMRDFVSSDDIESFRDGLPMRLQSQHKRIFDLIKKNLTEATTPESSIQASRGGSASERSRIQSVRMKGGGSTKAQRDPEGSVGKRSLDGDEAVALAQGMALYDAQMTGLKNTHMPLSPEHITDYHMYQLAINPSSSPENIQQAAAAKFDKYHRMIKSGEQPGVVSLNRDTGYRNV